MELDIVLEDSTGLLKFEKNELIDLIGYQRKLIEYLTVSHTKKLSLTIPINVMLELCLHVINLSLINNGVGIFVKTQYGDYFIYKYNDDVKFEEITPSNIYNHNQLYTIQDIFGSKNQIH